MKVLAVAHNGVLRENQNRWEALAERHPVELSVLIPQRWKEAQGEVEAEVRAAGGYDILVERSILNAHAALHLQPSLLRHARAIKPDVLDVFEEPWSLMAASSLVAQRLSGAALVVETEQNLAKALPPPFAQIWRLVLRRADAVVARSATAAVVAVERGASAAAVRVIPHGTDLGLFRPVPRAAPTGCLEVLFVGRAAAPEKGLSLLLASLARTIVPTRLTVAGPLGVDDVSVLRSPPTTRWLGVVPHEELPRVFHGADVCVVPSLTTDEWAEQFGRVLIEAMACGIPVIGSASGAIPEVLGDAGVIVPEGDAAALAGAIDSIASEPARWTRLREVGLGRARSRFSWPAVADELWATYELALSRRR